MGWGGPVSEEFVEPDDEVFFIRGEMASLNVRTEVINPSQSAALAASL